MTDVYVVSAFSKDNKGGNRAGVVLDSARLDSLQKMRIAKELGYSETAFVSESETADFKLEYFTPAEEVPLCGHATIAVFSALNLLNKLHKCTNTIETKAGILKIEAEEDNRILMEQNQPVFHEILEDDTLQGCFSLSCIESSLPIQIVSTGLKDILLPIDTIENLENMKPDYDKIARLSEKKDVVGIHAFALTMKDGVTAVCRNFAPLVGINEESATGTSNCALACYLFRYYEKKKQYVFEQGLNLNEPSRITVRIAGHQDVVDSVFAGGYGYLVCKKQLSM